MQGLGFGHQQKKKSIIFLDIFNLNYYFWNTRGSKLKTKNYKITKQGVTTSAKYAK